MELHLPHGPWKRLVNAQWDDYPLSIYRNPDKSLLFTIFERKDEKVVSLVIWEKKILLVEGANESIAGSQKNDTTIIEKIRKGGNLKFLIVETAPRIISYSETDLSAEIARQYDEIEALAKVASNSIKAYGGKATDLREIEDRIAQNVLSDPMVLLSTARGEHNDVEAKRLQVPIGIHDEGIMEIALQSASAALIVGGAKEKRLHAMHVFLESAMLNNVPCMIFDSSNGLTGLSAPAKDRKDYEKFRMEKSPMGFPFRTYELEKGLFIDLSLITPEMFMKAFGIENAEVAKLIKTAYEGRKESIGSMSDLISEISSTKETKETTQFAIRKAARVLEVISKTKPALFSKNISEELSTPWRDGVGKVIYIGLANETEEIRNLVIYSLLKSISKTPLPSLSLVVALEPDASVLNADIVELLNVLPKQGKGIIVQAENDIDAKEIKSFELLAEIVGNEAIVTEEGTKKRLTIRPAYSYCSEFENRVSAQTANKSDEEKPAEDIKRKR